MIKKTLYFGNPARLSVSSSQLRISAPGDDGNEAVTSRSIEDIGIVIIDNPQVTVTASVLSTLMDAGAAFLCCDKKHLPSGLMMHLQNNTEQSERFRIQLDASLPLKKQLWQQTVSCKIRNQCRVLEILTGENHGNMRAWINQVKSGDSENLEGRAAAYYWRTLFSIFPGGKRDRDGDEPNAILNYGYAILRAIVARALVSSGLHPTLGIFHRNKYNGYCLADDVMEPYRPYVDLLVFKLFRENEMATIEDLSIRRKLLAIATEDVNIGDHRRPLMVGVSETTASLFQCYSGELKKIKYPEIV